MGTLKKYVFGRVKGGVLDADAQAFITAASITNTTQKNAINTLVLDLKSFGLWSKMKAIYPMVGGNLFSHKFNLKDPRDLDNAYRLVFQGIVTHSVNGIQGDGINGFANTFLTPSVALGVFDIHISTYIRNDVANGNMVDIGSTSNDSEANFGVQGNTKLWFPVLGKNEYPSATVPNGIGLFTASKITTNITKGYRNGSLLVNAPQTDGVVSRSIYLMASNRGGSTLHSSRQIAFATIGLGLTDIEASQFYTAVQAFQTSLGRQV
jgi:hypothetical protein